MPIWTNDGSEWKLLATTGFPDEQALHSLVEKAPQVLPLAGSPQLVILGREVMLGNAFADLIAIEPTGRLAIIEVKLAKNAEARRAIVAQVLTYAAYLYGLDMPALERVLAKHIRDRGYSDLASAVSDNDQIGAFDLDAFQKGLAASLDGGRFRLVLVLDEVPDELLRLIAYLEAVTADRLLIDLVTVASYRIGDSEVIVPQRVDAERRLVELPPGGSSNEGHDGRVVDGVEEFDESIAAARDDQRPQLQRLRDWAVGLQREGLVTLQTFQGRLSNRRNLLPRLPDEGVGFVTIYNTGGVPTLQLFRKVLERRAPRTLPEIERLVAPQPLGQGTVAKNVSNELLDALAEAHREAAGRTQVRT
jgi:hypothetical protein